MSNLYCFATLIDHFHVGLDQIGELTDYQIKKLYFAPRHDKTGEILQPKKEPRARVVPLPVQAPATAKDEWAEYFDGFQRLLGAYTSKLLPKPEYEKALAGLKANYAHLKPTNKIASAREQLELHHESGVLTKEQYEEALEKLNQ